MSGWRAARYACALAGWLACLFPLAGGAEETEAVTDAQVLLVTRDENPSAASRSSVIARRVVMGVVESMSRYGYRAVDEEMLAAHYALTFPPRTSAVAVIRRLKQSPLSTVPALVMIESRAWAIATEDDEEERVVRLSLRGEMYDLLGGRFMDSFETTVETVTSLKCAADYLCIEEHVGEHAREVAMPLGNVLARKLERYLPPVVTGPPAGQSPQGVPVAYTVRFEYFEPADVVTIVGAMDEEFPGARNVDKVVDRGSALSVYSYRTTATAAKLGAWFLILLHDMGFDVGQNISFQLDGVNITMSKIVPTKDRRRSVDERRRCNSSDCE